MAVVIFRLSCHLLFGETLNKQGSSWLGGAKLFDMFAKIPLKLVLCSAGLRCCLAALKRVARSSVLEMLRTFSMKMMRVYFCFLLVFRA